MAVVDMRQNTSLMAAVMSARGGTDDTNNAPKEIGNLGIFHRANRSRASTRDSTGHASRDNMPKSHGDGNDGMTQNRTVLTTLTNARGSTDRQKNKQTNDNNGNIFCRRTRNLRIAMINARDSNAGEKSPASRPASALSRPRTTRSRRRTRKLSISKMSRQETDTTLNFLDFVHKNNPERVKLLEIAMTRAEVCIRSRKMVHLRCLLFCDYFVSNISGPDTKPKELPVRLYSQQIKK